MKGVKSDILGGQVPNPPTAVDAFVVEVTNIERTLAARSNPYHRLSTASATTSAFTSSRPDLDSLDKGEVREILQELRKLLPNWERPASVSASVVVLEEVQRAPVP